MSQTRVQRAEREVVCHLDRLLHERRMTGVQLAEAIGLHENSVSKLRTGDFSFLRKATLLALCDALDCQPGDLLTVQ